MSLAHAMCWHMIKSLMHANLLMYCIVKDLTEMLHPEVLRFEGEKYFC